ncbi:MAG TPA: serine/threonine-protein kinase [Polyangiaceae bacterium]|nr:serine/threonine-protein kinase [Polyangiaceae bacterium]
MAGKYRIDRILGAGGMGVVVAAHHIRLDDRVAIKFLLPEMLLSGEAVARFEREARAAVKIKSEHVARVSDVGTLENGAPYMVMEYLEGGDLAAWLKQRGPLPVEQATEFVLQACEAIAEAHALGIVHRDLKPANLFVIRRPDGAASVKVLDFGISKMRGGGSSSVPDVSITKTSAMMGSPLYMSPEQMQSAKDVDARSDIWALGVIVYELLAGESPFHAESIPELVAKILSMPPPSLTSRRPDVPQALEAVIFRCLEKDLNRRYESVGQLAAALVAFAPTRARISLERISGIMRSAGMSGVEPLPEAPSIPTEPGLRAPATTADVAERTQGAFGRTSAPSGRKALTLLVAGLAVIVIGAGALLFLFGQPAATELDRVAPTVAAEPPAAPSPPAAKALEAPPVPARAAEAALTATAAASPAPAQAPQPRAPRSPPVPAKPAPAAKAAGAPAAPAAAPATPAAPAPSPARESPSAFDDRK